MLAARIAVFLFFGLHVVLDGKVRVLILLYQPISFPYHFISFVIQKPALYDKGVLNATFYYGFVDYVDDIVFELLKI